MLDFGKPGLDKYPVTEQIWKPITQQSFIGREGKGHKIISNLQMPNAGDSAPYVAWPGTLQVEYLLQDNEPSVHIRFQWFNKQANRLPEAMWLSFQPVAPKADGWLFEKMGQPVSPLDVVSGGARTMHAVTQDVDYKDGHGGFTLSTLDAPVVSAGRQALLEFDNKLPNMTGGAHVSLFNNTWGTNYVMWINDDMCFRFVLRTA